MNMLIGVLCDVVSTVAAAEKEELAVCYVKEKVKEVLAELDSDLSGKISKEEFLQLIKNDDAKNALEAVGVDVLAMMDHADSIFQSDRYGQQFDKQLDFNEFMELVLQLHGGQKATVRDIVELRKFIHQQNTSNHLCFGGMLENQRIEEKTQEKILRQVRVLKSKSLPS